MKLIKYKRPRFMLNSMRGGHEYKKLTIKENTQVSDVYKNQDDKLILQTL